MLLGQPHRYASFTIERRATRTDTEVAAIAELDATDRSVLDVIAQARD
jgi:hypothetical protein